MFEINDKVLANIKRTFAIPSKPELLIELQAHLMVREPDIERISELISQDVGIAGGVLKVVNSSSFGLPRSVTNIKQSALYIGLEGINSVVTALVLKQSLSGQQCSISLDKFWDKASDIANIAVFIGKHFKERLVPEDIYTAALFQDCGIPAMALKYTDYNEIIKISDNSTTINLAELEEQKYQTNHAVVGYFIASTWQLPRNICQQVLYHHDCTFIDKAEFDDQQLTFAVIKMAENIVNLRLSCRDLVDWLTIKDSILEALYFSEDDYQDLIEDIDKQFFSAID